MAMSQAGKPPIWLAKLSTFSKELQAVRWPESPAVGIMEGCRLSDLGRTIFRATLQAQHRTTSPDELVALRNNLDRRWAAILRRGFAQ